MKSLVKAIDEHPAAVTYDFRTLGIPIGELGKSVSWSEAVLLFSVLKNKPGTEVFAALRKHEYAMSLEARIVADFIDSFRQVNSKHRPTPYPRPWNDETSKSKPPTVSQARIWKALNDRGYS